MAQNSDLGAALHLHTSDEYESSAQRAIEYRGSRYGTIFEESGVVVLNLIGPIYPRANMMTMSGATSIAQFTDDFVRAYNDPNVTGIVMNVDSPGGDVRGIGYAAEAP